MARVEPEAWRDREQSLVFIAGRLGEARRAEELLTERGMDYRLEHEPFVRAGLIVSELDGVGFYVLASDAEACRVLLIEHGLGSGVVLEPR
ncbi:MAG: hypothetical protein L0216_07345 [Planctomycetales bacterium]|nr:hypothetical protein [Planctomycetales bacterium]